MKKIDDETMTEEQFEALLQRECLVGESVGLREAASILMKAATEEFAHGADDKKAILLRSYAEQFKKMSEQRHPLKACPQCREAHYPEDGCRRSK